MSRKKTDASAFDFEASMAEIETIVGSIENDSLTLEKMISAYERGCLLLKSCDKTLKSARQRLEKLSLREEPTDNALAIDSEACNDLPTAKPITDYDDTISLF
jgi:exodeoxyribonuclease VII small subunit